MSAERLPVFIHNSDLFCVPNLRAWAFTAALICGATLQFLPSNPVSALNPDRLPSQYLVDRFGRESGLPSDTVWVVREGPNGYLWIGTRGGLVRFDGARFSVFNRQSHPAFSANEVRDLEWTPNGELWIATYGGGAMLMRDGEFQSISSADGLAGDVVYDIHRASDGALWFATGSGVSRFDGQEMRSWREEDGLASPQVFKIASDKNETLWFGGLTGGLSVFDGREMRALRTNTELDSTVIISLSLDPMLGVIAGTTAGNVYQVLASGEAQLVKRDDEDIIDVSLRDRDGNLWLGTYDNGLWRTNRETGRDRIPLTANMQSPVIVGLLEDRRGSLWVSSANGLFRVRDTPFLQLGVKEGLADKTTVVTSSPDGTLWVGTERSGIFKVAPSGQVEQQPFLRDQSISSLLVSRSGDLWVGSFGGGAFIVRDEQVTPLGSAEGLSSDYIFAIQETRQGNILLASDLAVDSWNPLSAQLESVFTEADGAVIRNIHQARDGSIWLGGNGGLYRFQNGEHRYWGEAEGLPSSVVSQVYEDERGVFWIAVRDGGLVRIGDGKLFSYKSEQGLPQLSSYAILEDRSRSLYISGSGGLLKVSRDELDAVALGKKVAVHVQRFDEAKGLRFTQFSGGFQPSSWTTPDNRLWFVTNLGLISFRASDLLTSAPQPHSFVEAVRVNGEELALSDAIDVPASMQSLEIDYSAPELAEPDAIAFRYSINDGAWLDAGPRRTAYFTSLPAGAVTFRVQAKLGDGSFSIPGDETATLNLYRLPRWYETTWSVLAALALLVLAMTLVQRVFSSRARVREAQLRQLVDQRTEELREALVRVEANARIDSLTGIANRRHMEEQLRSVWNMARRSGVPVSVIMLDIDRFKQYNDSLGHNAGDECLRKIANAISGNLLREHDMVARYGGEEFLVVLYDSDEEGVVRAAERILEGVRALKLPHPESDIHGFVTVSLGYATADVTEVEDPHKLVQQADLALYGAKRTGRNRALGHTSTAAAADAALSENSDQ
ncbi:MAG: diguanylate cyclase [Pseudomonadota bacterium]